MKVVFVGLCMGKTPINGVRGFSPPICCGRGDLFVLRWGHAWPRSPKVRLCPGPSVLWVSMFTDFRSDLIGVRFAAQ